jgi:hypothetical protein
MEVSREPTATCLNICGKISPGIYTILPDLKVVTQAV